MKTDHEILDHMHKSKNHKPNTIAKYRVAMESYTKFHGISLKELLDEADKEEKERIPWKERKLKQRLLDYRTYLIEEGKSKSTIQTYMTNVLAFYNFYEIELHTLPTISLDAGRPIRPNNLPDKEILRRAVDIAKPRMKAIITFMASSGCGRAETLQLTIEKYIRATREYHNGGSLSHIIETLNQRDDVVPTFEIKREKTGKYYTTFCSPEAVHYINDYLETRYQVGLKDPLFDVEYSVLGRDFNNINDKLCLGKVRKFNRLRSHMLRKFHASALYNDGMSRDFVNDLQGKTKNSVDEAYFFIMDEDLKHEYVQHLHAVQLTKEVEKVTVKSKEFREVEMRNIELANENVALKSEVEKINDRQDNLEKLIRDNLSEVRLGNLNKLI